MSWQVDSTGDGKVDDLIRFSADRNTAGALVGEVTHWSGPARRRSTATLPPPSTPPAGYSLTVAPSCMGNPTAISYRVQLTYDTKPGEAKPPLAFDVVPDQGLAGPVPIAVPTAPAAAPPAAGPAPAPPPRRRQRLHRPDRRLPSRPPPPPSPLRSRPRRRPTPTRSRGRGGRGAEAGRRSGAAAPAPAAERPGGHRRQHRPLARRPRRCRSCSSAVSA